MNLYLRNSEGFLLTLQGNLTMNKLLAALVAAFFATGAMAAASAPADAASPAKAKKEAASKPVAKASAAKMKASGS
ncbi:MAG: hypothetical protein IPN53_00995 [Comamonadaceae bacterium]|nr:hypothetical protein [Comamonadaceae bacterium]